MLQLSQRLYDEIRRHAEAAYPQECCGILVGTMDRTVTEAIATPNASEHPENHYEIALLELIWAVRKARSAALEILGFYHSHPDHPAHWYATDFAEAHWIGCSYVITAVEEGMAKATNAFLLAGTTEEDKRFEAEDIQIVES